MNPKVSALSALVALTICAPNAYSQGFENLLRTYLGTGNSFNSPISATEQGIIKTNINTRQAQLETQIAAGAQSGQLTAAEESDLRAQLDRIGNLEGSYLVDGAYTRLEVQNMLDELNNVSLRISTYLSNANTNIPGTAPAGGWNSRNWYRRYGGNRNSEYITNLRGFQADIDTKQAQIDASITDGTVSGRLNWNEANQLRAELNKIQLDETTMTADGRLSYSESQQLITALDTLSDRVTRMKETNWNNRGRYGRGRGRGRGNVNTSIDVRQSLLRQRIDAGIRSGRLTRTESSRLLADEARIAALEERMRASGNRLSFDEQRRLFSEIDILTNKLNKELYDRQVN